MFTKRRIVKINERSYELTLNSTLPAHANLFFLLPSAAHYGPFDIDPSPPLIFMIATPQKLTNGMKKVPKNFFWRSDQNCPSPRLIFCSEATSRASYDCHPLKVDQCTMVKLLASWRTSFLHCVFT